MEVCMSVVSSIVAKVAEILLVDRTKQEICYMLKCKTNIEEIRKKVHDLTLARENVKSDVEAAIRKGDAIHENVKEWLNSVTNFIEMVKKLDKDEDKAKKRCFKGLCPNFKARYSLSKKAANAINECLNWLEKGIFSSISYRLAAALQNTLADYARRYDDFASRMDIYKNIIETLKDVNVKMIGVYGMGGVGKTTLVRKVAAQTLEEKLFDEVVMVEVTQTPDVKKIQGTIADELGLELREENSTLVRAARLCERLRKGKRVLVILDNIWEKIELEAIGIPIEDGEKEKVPHKEKQGESDQCKILLTSRILDVCNDMNTQKNFQIVVLSDEEATNLFWKTVGNSVEKSDFINSIAFEIVKKCAGLPVAIVTIANALKNKSRFIWKDALNQLKKSNPRSIRGMDEKVYSAIELSYHFLENKEAKKLFLLCSLYNVGNAVPTRDVLKYGMSLDLFKNVSTLEEGRNRLHALINDLTASCLLLDRDTKDSVKMHDIIHSVAVSIAKSEKMFNMENIFDLKERLEEKVPEDSTAISLPYAHVSELPERLECPRLQLLLLFMKDGSLNIPGSFLEKVKELKVLHLTSIHLLSPSSYLCWLTSLQTLCLDNCQLGDITIIGELKRLKILGFRSSVIKKLPIEFKQLNRLLLLDLSHCSPLEVIAPGIISSLTRLEELYMGNSFTKWEVEGQSNASLSELNELSHLTTLEMQVLDVQKMPLPLDKFFEKLERYIIFIGEFWGWYSKYEISRTLKLKSDDSICLSSGPIKVLLDKAEDLYLDGLSGVDNVLYQLNDEGFPQLKHLHVENCSTIQHIIYSIGSGPCNVFPILESLFLDTLIELEHLCHGLLATESFSKLRIMKVHTCGKLKHLFSLSIAKNLSKLQELSVTNCEMLEEIVFKESEDQLDENEGIGKIKFTQLRTLQLYCLPSVHFGFDRSKVDERFYENLTTDNHDKFITIFSRSVMLPSLEELNLSSMHVECRWLDQLPVLSSCYQTLRSLTLEHCSGLKFLFSYSMVKNLVQLQELEIRQCEFIEEIINTEESRKEENVTKMIFPKLRDLRLRWLSNLKRFGSGNSLEFPKLIGVQIYQCPGLKTFFSDSKCADVNKEPEIQPCFDDKVILPTLEDLSVESNIVINAILPGQFGSTLSSSFQNLKSLCVSACHKLKYVFSISIAQSLVHLKTVSIWRCERLEVVIFIEEEKITNTILPQLENVTMLRLDNLTSVCSLAGNSVELPSLSTMYIGNCDAINTFAVDRTEIRKDTDHQKQPFFDHKLQVYNLKKLTFRSMINLKKIWSNQLDSDYLSKLSYLDVHECDGLSSIFHSSILGRLQKLKSLDISRCNALKEIIEEANESIGEEEIAEKVARFVFPQLTQLMLWILPELESLYTRLHTSEFPKLVELVVYRCDKLEILASDLDFRRVQANQGKSPHFFTFDNVAFSNLKKLEVSYCVNLINLMTVSMAKTLVQLTEFEVVNCKSIKEIIVDAKDEVKDEIVFNQLEYLKLSRLPMLTSFCKGNFTISFPSLEEVIVTECIKMENFSQGLLRTPKLQQLKTRVPREGLGYISRKRRVNIRESGIDARWEGDLNATIQQLFKEKTAETDQSSRQK